MPFTLYREKDGQRIPIKISISDAFRIAPPRRPKPINPVLKTPAAKPSPDKFQSPKKASDDKPNENATNGKNFSNHDVETYTAKDDAKIIAMKKDDKEWKEIMAAIGKKSESQLKNHYKLHLGPNKEEEQKKLADKVAKAEKNKAEGLAKQAEGQEKKGDGGGGGGGKKAGDGDGAKKTGGGGGGGGKKKKGEEEAEEKEKEKPKAKEESKEDKDTPAALTKQNLKAFVAKYERDKWLAVASRHYDLTGQRISPEVAKKMAEGK